MKVLGGLGDRNPSELLSRDLLDDPNEALRGKVIIPPYLRAPESIFDSAIHLGLGQRSGRSDFSDTNPPYACVIMGRAWHTTRLTQECLIFYNT